MEKDQDSALPESSSQSVQASDQELVRRIVENVSGAFELLIDRYGKLIFYIGVNEHGLSEEDAEELCTDVVGEVAKRINTYSPQKGALKSWIATIAKHRAIDRYRIEQRRREIERTRKDAWWDHKEAAEHPTMQVLDDGESSGIAAALAGLTEHEQQLLRLYAEKHGREDIARSLGMSPGSVKTFA